MRKLSIFVLVFGILGFSFYIISVITSTPADDETFSGEQVGVSDPQSPGNTQTVPLDNNQTDATIPIETTIGTSIEVNDFTQVTQVVDVGFNSFHLQTDSGYQILFNKNNSSFAVNISEVPVLPTRDRAVAELASLLGIEVVDLCLLNIYISTTYDFNPQLAGTNLGVGRCN